MALTPGEEIIRDEIVAAPDMVETPFTEPTNGGVGTRITTIEYHSVTVHPTKKYCIDFYYFAGPDAPNSGASSGTEQFIRDVT